MTRDWSQFALLLIDVQHDFWTPKLSAAFPAFESNIAALLSDCRAEHIDILHLHAQFAPDRSDWMPLYKLKGNIPCIIGTPGCEPLPCAQPFAGEPVFAKSCFDAMRVPALTDWLLAHNKRGLLLAGLETSVCVLFTAASAAQSGYLTVLLEDACADAPAAHANTLAQYDGKAFQRSSCAAIRDNHAHWLVQLKRLNVV